MGHYDECREGYCAGCGAAPGNLKNGVCPFCKDKEPKDAVKIQLGAKREKAKMFGKFGDLELLEVFQVNDGEHGLALKVGKSAYVYVSGTDRPECLHGLQKARMPANATVGRFPLGSNAATLVQQLLLNPVKTG